MSRYTHIFILAFLGSISLLLSSCTEGNYEGDPMFSLYVEDSPALDIADMFIQIDKVEISTDNSQWVNISMYAQEFNILQYVGGNSLNVAKGVVPKGHYTKLRVTFLDNITLNTFETSPKTKLDPKKATQTFDINYTTENNEQHIELMDIDIPNSVVKIDEENYVFSPAASIVDPYLGVVKGIVATKTGTGENVIAVAINTRMMITATSSDNIIRTTYTTQKGGKVFIRLKEGVYTIELTPMSDDLEHQPIKIENVSVKYSEQTNLQTIYIDKIDLEPVE